MRDRLALRTEPATNNVTDDGINKAVEDLPLLREKTASVIDQPSSIADNSVSSPTTVLPNGKRISGLKLDHPRLLAVMHALVRFAHIAAGGTFTTRDIHSHTVKALGTSLDQYSLASLRYDLSKLRAKGLVENVPQSRR